MKKKYNSPMIEVSQARPKYTFMEASGIYDGGNSRTKQRYSEEDALKSADQGWGDGLQKSIW